MRPAGSRPTAIDALAPRFYRDARNGAGPLRQTVQSVAPWAAKNCAGTRRSTWAILLARNSRTSPRLRIGTRLLVAARSTRTIFRRRLHIAIVRRSAERDASFSQLRRQLDRAPGIRIPGSGKCTQSHHHRLRGGHNSDTRRLETGPTLESRQSPTRPENRLPETRPCPTRRRFPSIHPAGSHWVSTFHSGRFKQETQFVNTGGRITVESSAHHPTAPTVSSGSSPRQARGLWQARAGVRAPRHLGRQMATDALGAGPETLQRRVLSRAAIQVPGSQSRPSPPLPTVRRKRLSAGVLPVGLPSSSWASFFAN